VCLVALALPAPALAAVNVTAFSVTPSTTQAGGHPDVTVSTTFQSNPSSDDVKDLIVRFPPGLLGNPNATPKCSPAQFAADTCPAGTALGSVVVTANATVLAVPANGVVSQGTVYNLPPVGAEPARLGIKVRPAPVLGANIDKISLIATAKLGPETGYALETLIANQPRTVGSDLGTVQLEVTKVDLTLRGQPGATPFMINPSSCAAATATVTAVPYDSGAPSKRTAPYTATGCLALPFAPTVSGTVGARGANRTRQTVALTTVLDFPAGNASLRDTVVLLPTDIVSNVAAIRRECPTAIPLDSCPASATIGSAEAASPLTAVPLRGPVVLKQNLKAGIPDLVVNLKGAAPLTLYGRPDFVGNRVRNTFPGAPDVPLSRFTLKVNGGKDGLLLAAQDLCRPDKKQLLSATLKGWNGAVVTRKVALKPQGCKGYKPPKPQATVKLRRRLLSIGITAGDYTKLRAVRVTLPKGVKVRRIRARARKGGLRSVKISRGRTVRVSLSRKGVTKLSLLSRRLEVSRKLIGRRVRVKIAAKDSTGRTVRLVVKTRLRR
jgi:hypothetical protein